MPSSQLINARLSVEEIERKRIKILYIITQGELGGAQRYVFDLATNLNNPPHSPLNLRGEEKGGYEILVAVGNEKKELSSQLEQKGIKVVPLKNLIRNIHPLKDIFAVFELKKLIQSWQPDIIHLNSSKAGVLGSIAAALAGNSNVVFTAHGFAFLEPNIWIVRQIYFFWEKIASYFRKKIITVSEFDRQAAIKSKLCDPEKLITIHNGIPDSVIPSFSRHAEGSPEASQIPRDSSASTPQNDKKIVIGTITHDYPTKDLATLKKAFAMLKPEFPNAELVIVGRGGTTGEVSDAKKYLETFDIYVCSSIKEGFPYSILEAAACGLPIVSTNVGGIPEAIEDGKQGLLVPSRDPIALAQAIKKLIADPQLAKNLGEAARLRAQQFSLETMISKTEQVYESMLR